MYKLLNFLLKNLAGRFSFILMNLFTLIFSVHLLIYMFGFMEHFSTMSVQKIDMISKTINGLADILVALGVIMESRIVITKMTKSPANLLEEYLNEIGEHNGMGLLILGLFMETTTAMIDAPNEVMDTRGIENILFYFCFFCIFVSIIVEIDLIKDYIKTFFKKINHEKNHSVRTYWLIKIKVCGLSRVGR